MSAFEGDEGEASGVEGEVRGGEVGGRSRWETTSEEKAEAAGHGPFMALGTARDGLNT